MSKHSLYEIIKPKLTPQMQKKVEDMIRYHELMGSRTTHEEDEY